MFGVIFPFDLKILAAVGSVIVETIMLVFNFGIEKGVKKLHLAQIIESNKTFSDKNLFHKVDLLKSFQNLLILPMEKQILFVH